MEQAASMVANAIAAATRQLSEATGDSSSADAEPPSALTSAALQHLGQQPDSRPTTAASNFSVTTQELNTQVLLRARWRDGGGVGE